MMWFDRREEGAGEVKDFDSVVSCSAVKIVSMMTGMGNDGMKFMNVKKDSRS